MERERLERERIRIEQVQSENLFILNNWPFSNPVIFALKFALLVVKRL